jgi:hypothetical protein
LGQTPSARISRAKSGRPAGAAGRIGHAMGDPIDEWVKAASLELAAALRALL